MLALSAKALGGINIIQHCLKITIFIKDNVFCAQQYKNSAAGCQWPPYGLEKMAGEAIIIS